MQREGVLITEQFKNLRLDNAVLLSIDTDALLSGCVKSSGGVLTSDLTLSGASLNVYGGNYFQTSEENPNVQNYSGKNSFLQAEHTAKHPEWGIACTGSRGYCILGIDFEKKAYRLSGDATALRDFVECREWVSLSCDPRFSVALFSGFQSRFSKLTSVKSEDDGYWYAYLENEPDSGCWRGLSAKTEEDFVFEFEDDGGDNALYCPGAPQLGNVDIANFFANHAEGGSTKAIGKYAHAEGRATTADGRYSHAEGSQSFAGGMYAHAEGNAATALGNASHAAGTKASALADRQYVWNGILSEYGSALSAAAGSFCVNPDGGLSGFYIGDKSLEQHLIDKGAATIKADMKTALSAVFDGVDDPEDVEFGKVAAALSAIWLKVQ